MNTWNRKKIILSWVIQNWPYSFERTGSRSSILWRLYMSNIAIISNKIREEEGGITYPNYVIKFMYDLKEVCEYCFNDFFLYFPVPTNNEFDFILYFKLFYMSNSFAIWLLANGIFESGFQLTNSFTTIVANVKKTFVENCRRKFLFERQASLFHSHLLSRPIQIN